jgi:tRNA (guanine-N7-)-methyltransferase
LEKKKVMPPKEKPKEKKHNSGYVPKSKSGKRPRDERNGANLDQNSVRKCPTSTELADGAMPQKKFYRSRAHCNPLSHNDAFSYPAAPADFDWSPFYPAHFKENSGEGSSSVEILDIGCGFGGLTIALAKIFPDQLTMAMEIRPKVCEYVRLRIEALRKQQPGSYQNVSCMKTNAMRYLPNFFNKGQMSKMFFCFPDPHFKTKNHRRRIVNDALLDEYAYLIRPGGKLYCITDVHDLHLWHVAKCDAHPLFVPVSEELVKADPAVPAMQQETEESIKVEREGGHNKKKEKYYAVYERIDEAQVNGGKATSASEVLWRSA